MTAANIFSRQNGTWMFFDTAVFDDDNIVRRFRSKVATDQRLLMAVGTCGVVPSDRDEIIAAYLASHKTVQDALSGLPALLTHLLNRVASLKPNRASWWERRRWKIRSDHPERGITMMVGWWNSDEGRGEAAIITDVDDLGPNYPPGILHSVRNVASPSPEFGEYFDYEDILGGGYSFDPVRDGAQLAAFERREPNGRGGYSVGGSFERFHIHAGGIAREVVTTWPDRIGAPIQLAA